MLKALYAFGLVLSMFVNNSKIAMAKPPQKALNIQMILWRGETKVEPIIKSELARLGYEVRYEVFDAKQNKDKLMAFLRESQPNFNNGKFDYVYTYGTTTSVATKRVLNDKVPQIFSMVTDPIEVGLLGPGEDHGSNISGIRATADLTLQIKNAHAILALKSIATLFNPREQNSILTVERLIAIGRDMKIAVNAIRIPPDDKQVVANLTAMLPQLKGATAVYLPPDSFLANDAQAILAVLNAHKIPTIGAVEKFLSEGALVGTLATMPSLGALAAKIIDLNQNGVPLSKIPSQYPDNPELIVNMKTLELLGLKIPKDIENKVTKM